MADLAEEYDLAREGMEQLWPQILSLVLKDRWLKRHVNTMEKLKEMIEYNVLDGKKFR